MDEPITNFEQVPLETVKKQIAKGEILLEPTDNNSLEPQPEAEEIEDLKYPQWQAVLAEALMEVDASRVNERIAVAEAAINSRLQTIMSEPDNRAERVALADALVSL